MISSGAAKGLRCFSEALPRNEAILRVWLEAIVLSGLNADLLDTLAANQADFRNALKRTLAAAGVADPAEVASLASSALAAVAPAPALLSRDPAS